jgi:ubiquinol-cytochrome c reductase iron-sulfur subunit
MATTERTSARAEEWRRRREAEDRAARWAAVCFVVSIVAALALFGVYVAGGQTQAEGVLIAIAFGPAWASAWPSGSSASSATVRSSRSATRCAPPTRSATSSRRPTRRRSARPTVGGRRRFLLRLLAGAGASLGLALLIPLRSLGPEPRGRDVPHLLGGGRPAGRRAGPRVPAGGHRPGRGRHRLPAERHRARPRPRPSWSAPARTSSTSTRSRARPSTTSSATRRSAPTPAAPWGSTAPPSASCCAPATSPPSTSTTPPACCPGPTGRPLPHLPLGVDDEGFLVALGDFNEPVGPPSGTSPTSRRRPDAKDRT